MNICIGIISYFPDEEEIREVRKARLLRLIDQCDEYFKLPIIVVAQNWKNEITLDTKNSRIIMYNFSNKLGITKARIILSNKFLLSEYDRIIFIDDDMVLSSQQEVDNYLSQIKDKDFYYLPGWLLNFSNITKTGLSRVSFDSSIDAEMGTGFEDWVFIEKCIKKLSYGKISSKIGLGSRKDYLNDKFSTWDDHDPLKESKNMKMSRKRIY